MHTKEQIENMERDLIHSLRQAAFCLEEGRKEEARHYLSIACQDSKYLELEIEAASAATEVGQ